MIVRLISVYEAMLQDHVESMSAATATEEVLYDLLKERPPEANISHREMPTIEQHVAFVRSCPYVAWYLVQNWPTTYEASVFEKHVTAWLGAVYLTKASEIGIFIFKQYQRHGFAREAVRLLRERHRVPLFANVAPMNLRSHEFFRSLGWRAIQTTYELKEEHHGKEETAT